MLFLRVLTLPVAMLAFSALYTQSIKAPQFVEIGSLILWMVLSVLVIARVIRTLVSLISTV